MQRHLQQGVYININANQYPHFQEWNSQHKIIGRTFYFAQYGSTNLLSNSYQKYTFPQASQQLP